MIKLYLGIKIIIGVDGNKFKNYMNSIININIVNENEFIQI